MDDISDPKWYQKWFRLGHEMTLQSHTPPDVASLHKKRSDLFQHPDPRTWCYPRKYEDDEKESLRLVFAVPPLPGDKGSGRVKIKLLKEIAPPMDGDIQRVFLARIIEADTPYLDNVKATKVAVEFFDPMMVLGDPHPSIYADLIYSNTVTAYDVLRDLQGRSVPRFYGSYTTTIPVVDYPNHECREVRVVLREYVNGTPLEKVDPASLDRRQRQRLVAQVIDAEQAFEDRGVSINDYYDTEAIILADNTSMRVVVWLFYGATFRTEAPPDVWLGATYDCGGPLQKWSKDVYDFEIAKYVDWRWKKWMKRRYGDKGTATKTGNGNHTPSVSRPSHGRVFSRWKKLFHKR